MARFGVDYSFGRPSMAALQQAGVTFACRYIGTARSGKNLSPEEARSLVGAGIDVVANHELSEGFMLDGHARGVDCARLADEDARRCGMPASRPIYFSLDVDPNGLSSAQWDAVYAFCDGAAEVLGRGRVGVYGGYEAIRRLLEGGKAVWGWQTYAWSGGRWHPRAHIQQYRNNQTIGGAAVDYNSAVPTDFGQWGAAGTIQEEDMASPKDWGDADWTAFWGRFDPHYKALLWRRWEEGLASEAEILKAWPGVVRAVVGMQATLQLVKTAVEAGQPVTLTQAQLDDIKTALQTLEGSALVQLAVSPAPSAPTT
jgi:hypothetical protein